MRQSDDSEQLFRSSLPTWLIEGGEPVFAEPWQAQAFAMTISLYNRGVFSWSEWTKIFSEQLAERAANGNDEGGQHYYTDWLAALEKLVSRQTDIPRAALTELKERWEEAYRTTPHGERVTLQG